MTPGNYPLVLKADDVAEILGISKRKAYEVMDYKGFPLIRLGRMKRVGREAFFKWVENESFSKLEDEMCL